MKKEKLPLQSRLQRQLFAVPDRMPEVSDLRFEGLWSFLNTMRTKGWMKNSRVCHAKEADHTHRYSTIRAS
jgi:hypothetical protein